MKKLVGGFLILMFLVASEMPSFAQQKTLSKTQTTRGNLSSKTKQAKKTTGKENSRTSSSSKKSSTDNSMKSKYFSYEFSGGKETYENPSAQIVLLNQRMKPLAHVRFYRSEELVLKSSYEQMKEMDGEKIYIVSYNIDMLDNIIGILEGGKTFDVKYDPKGKTVSLATSADDSAKSVFNQRVPANGSSKYDKSKMRTSGSMKKMSK